LCSSCLLSFYRGWADDVEEEIDCSWHWTDHLASGRRESAADVRHPVSCTTSTSRWFGQILGWLRARLGVPPATAAAGENVSRIGSVRLHQCSSSITLGLKTNTWSESTVPIHTHILPAQQCCGNSDLPRNQPQYLAKPSTGACSAGQMLTSAAALASAGSKVSVQCQLQSISSSTSSLQRSIEREQT